jgi:hypothetical protein
MPLLSGFPARPLPVVLVDNCRRIGMAVRDIVDESGTKWKVWAVQASSIHPKTAAEDFLGDYSEGWLCFECGNQRRRLARFPQDWDKMLDKELLRLMKAAQVVQPRKHTPPKPGDAANP